MIVDFKISATIDGVTYSVGEHVLNKEVSSHWYVKALIGDKLAFVIKDDDIETVIIEKEPKDETTEEPKSEREILKEQAVSFGIEFPSNIKTAKLKELIDQHIASIDEEKEPKDETTEEPKAE